MLIQSFSSNVIVTCNYQIKATEQYFRWCGLLYSIVQVVLTFLSVGEIRKCITIQMKATAQYFPVVLFIMLYKLVLTFEPVGEILKYLNESNTGFDTLSRWLKR